MINKNSYRPSLKSSLFVILMICVPSFIILGNTNIKAVVDNEVQDLQSHFTTFSNPSLLIDDGSGNPLESLSASDIPLITKKIFKVMYHEFSKTDEKVPKIELFIKFKQLEKIYSDRKLALADGFRIKSSKVPCKISDGVKIYKCKVRLKGHLPGHYYTKKRMSFQIEIIGGYLHGLKEFSIQKPRARQFPYDHAFHEMNSRMGRLAQNRQVYLPFFVNGESWGIMTVEPSINQVFLEAQNIKRSTVIRISDRRKRKYNLKESNYPDYYISDPRLYFGLIGKKRDTYKSFKQREIYSYVGEMLSNSKGAIFDREQMISNLSLGLIWGSLHALLNSNAYYTWNDYTHKLEPILTDQSRWQSIFQVINIKERKIDLPFEYKLIFNNMPLAAVEIKESLKNIQMHLSQNNPLELINSISLSNFRYNSELLHTPLLDNLDFLLSNYQLVTDIINNNSTFDLSPLRTELTNKQLSDIKEFVRVMHFDSGKVKIYNLTGSEVSVQNITFQGQVIPIKKIIAPSDFNTLKYLEVILPKKGIFDNEIVVTSSIRDIKKIAKNDFTFIDRKLSKSTNNMNKCSKLYQDSLCLISGDLVLEETIVFDKKVHIMAGTKIILKNGASIIFKNSVNMLGSIAAPINIKSQGTGSIIIKNSPKGVSMITNVFVDNLGVPVEPLYRYSGAFNGYGGKFIIKNLSLSNNRAEDQLNIVHATVQVDGLVIFDAISDAFDCDFCSGKIKKIEINNSNGDGLDISGSDLHVVELLATGVRDKALSVGERSNIRVETVNVTNSGNGVVTKDASNAIIENYSSKQIKYNDFMTYRKKAFFLGNTKLNVRLYANKNAVKCTREQDTILKIEDDFCMVKDVNVKNLYSTIMKK